MRAFTIALVLMVLLTASGCGGSPSNGQTTTPDSAKPVQTQADSRWLIVPGERIGEITAETGEADLVAAYGQEQVVPGDVYVGEGFSEPGTIVFPHQPEKRLEIIWTDPKEREKPDVVLIRGEKTLWHTEEGITLGTPVSKLELANEGPFSLYGFGWDYGGTITGWEDGRLTPALRRKGGALMLRLTEGNIGEKASPDEIMSISGDREIPSDHPVVQQIDPMVNEMALRFFHTDTSEAQPAGD